MGYFFMFLFGMVSGVGIGFGIAASLGVDFGKL